jgi:hypothetical protein
MKSIKSSLDKPISAPCYLADWRIAPPINAALCLIRQALAVLSLAAFVPVYISQKILSESRASGL